MNHPGGAVLEERILVLAPTAQDAALTHALLADAAMLSKPCDSLAQLCEEVAAGAAAIVLNEEALAGVGAAHLADELRAQPVWSDVPVLVLTARGADSELARMVLQSLPNVTLLERPVRILTLVSVLRSSLKARRRQYALRDQLQALRDSEERLRLAIAAASMFWWSVDLVSRELRWSYNTAAVIGCDAAELPVDLGGWSVLLAPEDSARLEQEFREAVADRRAAYACEFRGLGEAHDVRHYVAQVRLVYDELGTPLQAFGVTQDITERKRAELALQEADRRKDDFLATLAHELRNPLAPIRIAAQILKSDGAPEAGLAWSRGVIERQVAHMARLLDDLLDVSRITRNRLELRKSRIRLADVVTSALETSRPLIEAAHHEIVVKLPAAALELEADPVRIAQVLSNLLNNAAKYTPDGGRITLSAQLQRASGAEEVDISVQDNGIGIDAETLPHVFDMFAQSATALARAQGGLGIGLSLAKGLVEMHGGRVVAHSAGTGLGSRFDVYLPVAQRAPAHEHEAGAGERLDGPRARLRVLVADDSHDSADSLSMLLQMMGYEVHTAYDGDEAIVLAERLRPDAVLLDLGMPRMSGHDVCRHLRQQAWSAGLVVVALTGWGQSEDRRRSQDVGFDFHLVKPVDPGELDHLLSAVPQRAEAG